MTDTNADRVEGYQTDRIGEWCAVLESIRWCAVLESIRGGDKHPYRRKKLREAISFLREHRYCAPSEEPVRVEGEEDGIIRSCPSCRRDYVYYDPDHAEGDRCLACGAQCSTTLFRRLRPSPETEGDDR